jgi:hypothetical protein
MLIPGLSAHAVNSVTVESRQVARGAMNVVVGIYLENELPAAIMTMPLEFRSITPGAFISERFSITATGRVATSVLTQMEVKRFCGNSSADFACSGPLSHSWGCPDTGDIPADFFVSPSALLWVGLSFVAEQMAPGRDPSGDPSFTLTFDVTDINGRFEIDTCCMTPANHLAYAWTSSDTRDVYEVPLEFTRGIITIGDPLPNHPPVAVCSDSLVNLRGEEVVEVEPGRLAFWSTDSDRDLLSFRAEPPGPYQAGEYELLIIVDDGQASDSCRSVITVVENRSPVARCRDLIVNASSACQARVVTEDLDDGSFDPDGDPLTFEMIPPGPFYPVGQTEVSLIVSDGLRSDTCHVVIEVLGYLYCPPAVSIILYPGNQAYIPDLTLRAGHCGGEESAEIWQVPAPQTPLWPEHESVRIFAVGRDGDTAICDVPIRRSFYDDDVSYITNPNAYRTYMDITPGNCPNSITRADTLQFGAMFIVAILGTDTLDVTRIGAETLRLGDMAPVHWEIDDVSGPGSWMPTDPCACGTGLPDGNDDLLVAFDLPELLRSFGDVAADTLVWVGLSGSVAGEQRALEAVGCLMVRAAHADAEVGDAIPESWELSANYPNPFNGETVIRYRLPRPATISIDIYNVLGQRIRTLVDGPQNAGLHDVSWDGRDRSGRAVGSGVYFYRLTAEGRSEMKKMTLLR